MLIATFGPTTAGVGRKITYDDESFLLQDHGPIDADDVLAYDRDGHLLWAYDGLREWVAEMADLSRPKSGLPEVAMPGEVSTVGAALLGAITSGAKGAISLAPLTSAAVRSRDYPDTWIVAMEFLVPALGSRIGVWATDSLDGDAPIYSADRWAACFTAWPDASESAVNICPSAEELQGARDALTATERTSLPISRPVPAADGTNAPRKRKVFVGFAIGLVAVAAVVTVFALVRSHTSNSDRPVSTTYANGPYDFSFSYDSPAFHLARAGTYGLGPDSLGSALESTSSSQQTFTIGTTNAARNPTCYLVVLVPDPTPANWSVAGASRGEVVRALPRLAKGLATRFIASRKAAGMQPVRLTMSHGLVRGVPSITLWIGVPPGSAEAERHVALRYLLTRSHLFLLLWGDDDSASSRDRQSLRASVESFRTTW